MNKINKNTAFKISNYKIGLKNKPFIIAEMSGNHNQSVWIELWKLLNACQPEFMH